MISPSRSSTMNNPCGGRYHYKPYDPQTAELKRIWTRSDLRRQGLALVVLQELERRCKAAPPLAGGNRW
jgi:hypothetical protein